MMNDLQTKRSLPFEVIERIIYSIDDRELAPRLFPLLTVSKRVFAFAVERLYEDPFKSLASCRNIHSATCKLVALIAVICPEVDESLLYRAVLALGIDPQSLADRQAALATRHSTETNLPQSQCARPPYFSFVRIIHLRPEFDDELLPLLVEHNRRRRRSRNNTSALREGDEDREVLLQDWMLNGLVMEPLFWTACGQQYLGNLRIVSINIRLHLPKFSDYLARMTRLESIICYFIAPKFDGNISYRCLERQVGDVRAVLWTLSREQRAQREKITDTKPLSINTGATISQFKSIDVQLCCRGQKDVWYHDPYLIRSLRNLFKEAALTGDNRVFSVEAIYNDDMSKDCDPNWVRFYVMPESIDMKAVRCIRQYVPGYMNDRVLSWPTAGKAAILQQCRGLRHLAIYAEEGEDATLFAWAREERQRVLSYSSNSSRFKDVTPREASTSSNAFQRLIQLETLHLGAPWGTTMDCSLRGALFAFGPTLQRIRLDAGGMEIDLALFRNLPELRELEIETGIILCSTPSCHDPPMFSGCPRLVSVALQEDGDGEVGDNLDIWRGLHHLRKLSLIGPVAYRFQQATFALSGANLEELTMFSEEMNQSPDETVYTWDVECWRHLVKLRKLRLRGAMAIAFRASMLLTCPDLREVDLAGPLGMYGLSAPQTLDRLFSPLSWNDKSEEGEGEGEERKSNTGEGQDDDGIPDVVINGHHQSCRVAQLDLSGWNLSSLVLDASLPAMFPALEKLEIRVCSPAEPSPERLQEVRERFPKLEHFTWR
ncbi:hypothetical protein BGW42_005663 [Actinomortierella wolfii]|nr:hypothetical protein BGW42_005663 [Actinomortierella wolfii]